MSFINGLFIANVFAFFQEKINDHNNKLGNTKLCGRSLELVGVTSGLGVDKTACVKCGCKECVIYERKGTDGRQAQAVKCLACSNELFYMCFYLPSVGGYH